jgi:two-component system OmpR family response regulator
MIEAQVWGSSFPGLSNTVDVHIKRLRQKLDRPGEPSLIETIRGAGYRLRAEQP